MERTDSVDNPLNGSVDTPLNDTVQSMLTIFNRQRGPKFVVQTVDRHVFAVIRQYSKFEFDVDGRCGDLDSVDRGQTRFYSIKTILEIWIRFR